MLSILLYYVCYVYFVYYYFICYFLQCIILQCCTLGLYTAIFSLVKWKKTRVKMENSSKWKEHQRKNTFLGGITGKLHLGEG